MRLLPALVIPAALLALVITFLVLVFGGIDTAGASDFDHQCEVAIPDPSSTTTPPVASLSAPATSASPMPTENPYAQLTFAADDTSVSDRQRACASAMRTAVYQQGPPLSAPATGAGPRCAGETIAALVNRGSRGDGQANDGTGRADAGAAPAEPAAVTAAVLRWASAATSTGYCQPLTDAEADTLSAARSGRNPDRCPLPGTRAMLDLPDNVAAQSLCGQLVGVGAESTGDLVFWDYRGNAPTRVGMAVGAGRLSGKSVLVVSWDPHSGGLVQLAMPNGWDVRVKRVLGDAA